jgi:hypothetical protein
MFNTKGVEHPHYFILIRYPAAYLYHLGKVFDKPAIRSFRGLARANPPPLRGVEITRFEMGL